MDYLKEFSRGDKVEVSTNRDFSSSMFGELIRVANNGVNIRYTMEEEWGVLRFCWHEDDPRMQELGKFEESQGRNTDDLSGEIHMGIFRLARSQRIINEMPAQLLSLNEKVDAMDRLIERLMRKVDSLLTAKETAKPAPPRRGPGRPPKREPEKLETAGVPE